MMILILLYINLTKLIKIVFTKLAKKPFFTVFLDNFNPESKTLYKIDIKLYEG